MSSIQASPTSPAAIDQIFRTLITKNATTISAMVSSDKNIKVAFTFLTNFMFMILAPTPTANGSFG